MAWRYFFLDSISSLKMKPSKTLTLPISASHSLPWNPNLDLVKLYLPRFISPFSTSFLPTKSPKKFKKKGKKKESPRTKLIQTEANRISYLEHIVKRDIEFKFLIKSKQFLSKQPEHVLRLDDAGKLYHELGFPRGRKVSCSIGRHPLIFETYRHTDGKMWFGSAEFMEELLSEEQSIMDAMEMDRVDKGILSLAV
ncbi:uncharacterized protein LOC114758770 [Neltuma alba]|uniref:uncharacterized protein LOC114758770 n=1 Tax=Neltuma alba TaxID=207710 RepID=UPI0010A51D54|nr:uncharacterized protein LOC114758770 [Prosopis alba]XP_028803696.1 uncharacterized protein LOC114758770 [Prosopis alba]